MRQAVSTSVRPRVRDGAPSAPVAVGGEDPSAAAVVDDGSGTRLPVLAWGVCAAVAAAAVLALGLTGAEPDQTRVARHGLLAVVACVLGGALLRRASSVERGQRAAWFAGAALAPLAVLVLLSGGHGTDGAGAVARGTVGMVLLAALVASPGVRRSPERAVGMVLDGWCLAAGPYLGLLVAFSLTTGVAVTVHEPAVALWTVADLVALALLLGLTRRTPRSGRLVVAAVTVSVAAMTAADTVTWLLGVDGAPDVVSDALWAVAIVLAAAAGVSARLFENSPAREHEALTWLPTVIAGSAVLLVSAFVVLRLPLAWPLLALAVSLVGAVLAQTALLLREQTRLYRRLHEASVQYRTIVTGSRDVILVTDAAGVVRFASPAVESLLSVADVEVVGRPVGSFVHSDDVDHLLAQVARVRDGGSAGDVPRELRMHRSGGGWRHVEVTVQPHDTEAVPDGTSLVLRDVSDRVRMQRELERRARYDSLTGLPNRWWFGRQLEERLDAGLPSAVLFVDLDRFKQLNDSEGHAVGDRLLVQAARRLSDACGEDDVVGRLSGDEFAAVLSSSDAEHATAVATRVLDTLSEPYSVGRRHVSLSASVGVALAPPDREVDGDGLLRDADLAMYEAKRTGRSRVALSHPGLLQAAVDRTELNRRVRAAVQGDVFELAFQPVVDMRSGEVLGAEALLRWPGSDLLPDTFVPELEQAGLVVAVGAQVLRKAVGQAARWYRDGRAVAVSVNLSALQLEDDLPERVADVLRAEGLPPGLLTLEVTESVLMRDLGAAERILSRLRGTGVHVALDDFGTGYSSLSYIHRLPIDALKIDRSFVRAAAGSGRDEAVLRSIVDLGRQLGLTVVAEGVEEQAQADLLLELGCVRAQGFLYARPGPAAAMAVRTVPGVQEVPAVPDVPEMPAVPGRPGAPAVPGMPGVGVSVAEMAEYPSRSNS